MRRIALIIILSCLTLGLMAQRKIKVHYNGSAPTITDFTWAAFPSLNFEYEEETGDRPWKALQNAMERHRKGLQQEPGETLVIDSKNGYILFERTEDSDPGYVFRLEACYWNESDGKHILIAFNDMASFTNGKPSLTETSYFYFFRYDNVTKRMVSCDPPGFEIDFCCTYELQRNGKNIDVKQWNKDGSAIQKLLKWNGKCFTY